MRVHLRRGRLVVHRPDLRLGLERVAQRPLSRDLHDLVEEGVVDPLVHEHALGRAADLTRAEEAAEHGALRRTREVGVLADDDRAVPARLDERALEPCGADDLLRGRVRADETDPVDSRMRDQALADLAAAVDDVDDAVGQPGLGHDLHEVRHRERRPLRRLDHDRVAGCDARRDQLDRDQRGEVPRCDRRVDAVRLAEGEDPLVRVARRDDRRLHPLHVLGGDAEVLGRLVDVGQCLALVRLPLLECELAGKVLAPCVDQVGDRVAHLRALPGRASRPDGLRRARGRDGGVDVGRARVGRFGERLAGDRGDDGTGAVAGCSDPRPTDEVLERADGESHAARFYDYAAFAMGRSNAKVLPCCWGADSTQIRPCIEETSWRQM